MKRRSLQIFWFSYYDLRSPSVRYRGKLPLEYLENNFPVKTHFYIPTRTPVGILQFLKVFCLALFSKSSSSLIVIQKVLSNGPYAKALQFLTRFKPSQTLYDLDDAEQYRFPVKQLHFFLTNCQKVAVGSHALHQYCQQFNKQVYWQTSAVLSQKCIKQKQNKKLHLGWIGDYGTPHSTSFSHRSTLNNEVFPEIQKIKIPIKLSLIGVKVPSDIALIKQKFAAFSHIEICIPEQLDWTNDDWLYPKIAEFDVGLAPYTDHPFCHAKSAFKIKQYLSCGVPVIASNIGDNSLFVKNGFNGFLLEKPTDLVPIINTFAMMDAATYSQMNKNCLQRLTPFSIENYCKILLHEHFYDFTN